LFRFSFKKENLEEHRRQSAPLLRAALKGDWVAANAVLLEKNLDRVRARITIEEATTLHIAAASGHTTFVKELLKSMEPIQSKDDLELKTNYGFTALHSAAQSGNVRIAMQLVNINKELPLIPCDRGDTPLIVAAYLGHTNMVSYLFSETPLEQLTDEKRIVLFRILFTMICMVSPTSYYNFCLI
jgi:ankyrin repeat protein